MPSNCRYAMVPVASCVSVWSMRIPISWPGTISPLTRWPWMIFSAMFSPMLVTPATVNPAAKVSRFPPPRKAAFSPPGTAGAAGVRSARTLTPHAPGTAAEARSPPCVRSTDDGPLPGGAPAAAPVCVCIARGVRHAAVLQVPQFQGSAPGTRPRAAALSCRGFFVETPAESAKIS